MADVVPVEDGTDIEVQCAYGEVERALAGEAVRHADYAIYVVDRDGHATEIKRWKVKPNQTMTPDGHTGLKVRQIEKPWRSATRPDQTVLRANLR